MPAAKPIAAAPVEFVGIVTSRNSKVITADFEGRVDRLDLFNGKHVKAGQVVAHLDDSELQARLRAAQAKKSSAQASAAKAGAIYANAARKAKVARYLARSGAASPEELRSAISDQSAAGAEGGVAEGDIKAANADIAEVQRLLASADVKAPIDGVVAVVKTKEGELAHKGTAIARVFDPESLVIRFGVPHASLPAVKLNTQIVLTTEDGTKIPATVQRQDDDHDPTIDLTTFEAAIDPTIRIDGIRVGEYGHVRIAAVAAQGAAR